MGVKIKTNNKAKADRTINLIQDEGFLWGVSSCCSASNQISLPTVTSCGSLPFMSICSNCFGSVINEVPAAQLDNQRLKAKIGRPMVRCRICKTTHPIKVQVKADQSSKMAMVSNPTN